MIKNVTIKNEEKTAVSTYSLNVREKTAGNWYESCSEVFFGPTNDVMVNSLCQPPQGEPCTPYYWLDYQGKNVLAPVNIEYRLVAEPNETTIWDCTSLTGAP